MRALIGIAALSLIACSSAAPTGDPTKPDPNKPVQPVEPAPVPVYTTADYPTAPYGIEPGSTLADFEWTAVLAGAPKGTSSKIKLSDYYDPDGARGINAVLYVTSAEWCGACRAEAQTFESKIRSDWGAKGVLLLEAMIEDIPRVRTLEAILPAIDRWRSQYGLIDVTMPADPTFHFARSGTNGLPVNIIFDPRTMIVKARLDGFGPAAESAINSLVNANKIQ